MTLFPPLRILIALLAVGVAVPTASVESQSTKILLVPPLAYAPTSDGISINAVRVDRQTKLKLEYRKLGGTEWMLFPALTRGADVVEWHLRGLLPGTHYEYRIAQRDMPQVLAEGSFWTQRPPGAGFKFVLLTDTHVFVRDFTPEEIAQAPPYSERPLEKWRWLKEYSRAVLQTVAKNIEKDLPDFVIHLGDVLDFHGFGFNAPSPGRAWTRKGYLTYRKLLSGLTSTTSHFMVVGNWDGENGDFSPSDINRSRTMRHLYLPNPELGTYPEGGSRHRDYFAFTWGDALFAVLNVMTYTSTHQVAGKRSGKATDWTLGAEQRSWLERTLQNATSKWKFLLVHHTVGGNGGNPSASIYGRGGGRASSIGEQAWVHALMKRYGVHAFFYGHDHVFTDIVVDGIHYTLPGSGGAPWKFDGQETGYDRYWPDSGHARVAVTPARVAVEFVNQSGTTFHRYEIVQ